MMVLKKIISWLFKILRGIEEWSAGPAQIVRPATQDGPGAEGGGLHSVWDCLNFRENTQAFHVSGVLGFEGWASMDEIRRRVKEIFGVEYKNERSLYPYLKTLGDIGLVENTDAGGKRQWRKKDILVKTGQETGSTPAETAKARAQKKQGS